AVLAVLWILSLVGLPLEETVTTVILLLAATPAAASATMFAEKYDCDAVYTSRAVVISTLVSIVTMPLILLLASALL
ncbi:MAG: AEC family transporter, partial [Clostridia bacterium]|nr:AEC family transporter [Clostridia bacterium]